MAEQTAKPRGKPYPKGVSGNPGGRPKAVHEVVALAQAHASAAQGMGRWETIQPGAKGGRPKRVLVLNDGIGNHRYRQR